MSTNQQPKIGNREEVYRKLLKLRILQIRQEILKNTMYNVANLNKQSQGILVSTGKGKRLDKINQQESSLTYEQST